MRNVRKALRMGVSFNLEQIERFKSRPLHEPILTIYLASTNSKKPSEGLPKL